MKYLVLILSFIFSFSSFGEDGLGAIETMPQKIPRIGANGTSAAMSAAIAEANTSASACDVKAETAGNICIASRNSNVQTALILVSGFASLAKTFTSTSDACKKQGETLKLAQNALTAYNTACATVQSPCDTACTKVVVDLKKVSSLPQVTGNYPGDPIARAKAMAALPIAESIVNQCGRYKMAMAAAAVGIMNLLRESQSAKACEEGLTDKDCLANPNQERCKVANDKDDCTKSENQNSKECICRKAPNTPGCPGAINTNVPVVSTKSSSSGTDSKPSVKSGPSSSDSDSGTSALGSGSGSGGGSGLGGSGGSGGGSGLDGGNASSKTGAVDGAKSKGGLNTNILSGYDGGGGGAGGRGGSGSGNSAAMNSAYKAYLPGGEKDPQRGVASQLFGNGEVTSAGSKSNWEKIRERYQDNKPNLVSP